MKFNNFEECYGGDDGEEIYAWEIEKGIKEIGDYPYIETSSKNGTNVFEYLLHLSVYESWLQTETKCARSRSKEPAK